ncbi:MAG: DNRLRE domain-containing protein [Desulfomonilaceae bacterium]
MPTGSVAVQYLVNPIGINDFPSAGVVNQTSNLPSTGGVAASGFVAVQYLVNPIGINDFPSAGVVNQTSNLPSTGSISAYGNVTVKYEVVERPKVTVALSPVADAFVIDDKPTMNYGDTDDLVVGRYYSSLARSFLRFGISSLRADLLIISAVLRLSARFFENGQVGAYSLFNSWLEYDVTWLNQPGRNIVPESTASMGQTVDLDITQLFMGWYKQTRANYGVAVTLTDESVQAHSVYLSREWPQAIQRPQLLITHYLPAGIPSDDSLASRGQVIGHTYSDLSSTGTVGGGWSDISSVGKASRSFLTSTGIVSQVAYLPSTGAIRGLRIANDFNSLGVVSRPFIFSSGKPRIHTQNDFSSTGYVYYRYDLPSTGSTRVYGYNDISSAGYVAHAQNELPSTGVVTGYYNDITSSGAARVASFSDLQSSGYVAHARNELPSSGRVTGPWMRSSGIVAQTSNMYSKGGVRISLDLSSTGFVTYSGHSDLAGVGLPRIRAVSEIMSYGVVGGGTADLPSRGHVGAWVLRVETTVSAWPPAGRSVR